eukprot:scaffold22560_cov135-Cylindrotheca_fusiformis.AAC.9
MLLLLAMITACAMMQTIRIMKHTAMVDIIGPTAIDRNLGMRKRLFRKPSLVNYTQDQGFDPIETPYIMNAETTLQYMSLYGTMGKPIVYFITPTYKRKTQLVDLVTLSQTLQHDKGVYWIVIEDAEEGSKRVRDILERSGMMFAHGSIESEEEVDHTNPPRGVLQRNLGMDIVESIGIPGVVYFGDDDNGYDIRLLEGIRHTEGVGVFGVGFRSQAWYARCIVDSETGKVSRMTSKWYEPGKNVAMDMAGFCAHTDLIKKTKARFRNSAEPGRIENDFLNQLGKDVSEMEPLLDNCTKIYAWHVQSYVSRPRMPDNITEWDPQFESIHPGV